MADRGALERTPQEKALQGPAFPQGKWHTLFLSGLVLKGATGSHLEESQTTPSYVCALPEALDITTDFDLIFKISSSRGRLAWLLCPHPTPPAAALLREKFSRKHFQETLYWLSFCV